MERIGSIGLNSALIQDSAPAQDAGNTGIHRKPVEFGKAGPPGGGGAIWARGAGDRDPLFPEPGIGPSKAFNGGAARWGGNEPKKWAGVRQGEGDRRAVPPAAGVQGGARRWDDTRAPVRAANWVNEAKEAENWRGARAVPRNNDIPWRKGDGRREGAGALPNGTFGVAHGVLPGARAGVGLRPPQAHRAAAGVNTKYSKADLMDVFHKMKDEVGDEIPPPDEVVDEDEFRDIWRPLADRHVKNEQAHVHAPPGLDPAFMRKTQLEQVSKHFVGLDVRFPLQALHLDQYFYQDPAGNIQGPFPSLNLKGWNDQGWLYDDLQCQSAACRETFFSFATLKSLWDVGASLRLQPAELERLSEAEARFGTIQVEEHVPQGMGPEMLAAGDNGSIQTITGAHGVDHVEHQMQAVDLADGGEHARLHDWVGAAPEQPVDMHAAAPAQALPFADSTPLPAKPDPSYDPIDDIIDEPGAQRPAIDPRDGGRVLQPFAGMGSSGVAGDSAIAAATPVQQGNVRQPARLVQQDQSKQQPARMRAADPILNIPVHVERAPVAPEPMLPAPAARAEPAAGAATAQYISPYELFASKQPAAQTQLQPAPQVAAPRHVGQADGPPVYVSQSQATPAAGAAAAPGARGWATPSATQPNGVPLADIQREELKKRQQEEVAAQAAAQATAAQEQQDRERRAAWTAQPQPVPLRQIMEDEECAAELEGGYDAGKDDYAAPNYNPWQAQSALPQETQNVHIPGADSTQVFWEAPAQAGARAAPAPRSAAPRTAAQVVGKEQAKPQARRANAAPAGNGRPAAWQAATNRPAATVEKVQVHAAAPGRQQRSVISGELEPEVFRNSPEFREWCMKEMERLQGNENVLVVLLETGANCEIMEIARSNLKGDNIGAFVAEFIKRKAQAQVAKAPGRRKRRGGAAAAPAAAPAPGPARNDTMVDAGAGDGFVSVAGKGRGGKRKGAQPAASTQRAGGNAFAMLPSM